MNWEDKLNGKIKKDLDHRKELEKKVQEEKKKMEEQQKQKQKLDFFNETLVPTYNELVDKFSKGYQTEIRQQAEIKELGLTLKVKHDIGYFTFKSFITDDKFFYEESVQLSSGTGTRTAEVHEFKAPEGDYTKITKEHIQETCVDAFIKFFDA